MVGGLIVSQALTLFTTPVVYLYLDRLSNWFADWGTVGRMIRTRRTSREAVAQAPDQASRRVT